MTDKPAMTIEEMASDLATRCGWVTNDGFRLIHPDDLARAFLNFSTEAYERGRRDGLEEGLIITLKQNSHPRTDRKGEMR